MSTSSPAQKATTLVTTAGNLDPSLSGYVYIDSNGNGQKSAGDWAVGGATVSLYEQLGSSLTLVSSKVTGSDGSYSFSGLSAGTYNLMVPVFSDLISGEPSPGEFMDDQGNLYPSSGAPVSGNGTDAIESIDLQTGLAGFNFDFSELGVQGDMVSKRMFLSSDLGTSTYWLENAATPPQVPEPSTLILLAAGAVCCALVWQRRRGKRKRLARDQNHPVIMVGRARASPRREPYCGRGPRPENIGPTGLLTNSFQKVRHFFKLSLKERVMKAVRIISIALAVMVTAMVSQSRASLVYDLAVDTNSSVTPGVANVYAATDGSETPLPSSDYTLTTQAVTTNNGTWNEIKGIQFNSAADVPTGGAIVVMDVFADVLDASGYYGAWNSTYGGKTTTVSSKKYTAPTTYDPTSFQNGHFTIPTAFPYLALGINQFALSFTNSASSSPVLAGTITGSVDSTAGALNSSNGTHFANPNGGLDLGPGTDGGATASYFYGAYTTPGNTTTTSAGFSFLTGSSDNPNGNYSYVTINGKNYEQLFLGTISFTISAGAAGASASITPVAPKTLSGNSFASYWMEDGTQYESDPGNVSGTNTGTINTGAPVNVSIAPAASGTAAVGVTAGTTGYTDLLLGGSMSIGFTVSNTSGTTLNSYTLGVNASAGTAALTSGTTGSLSGPSSAVATGTYTAQTGFANTGTVTITGSITSSDAGVTPSPASSSTTVNVGAASAPSSTSFAGNVLKGDVGAGNTYAGLASIVTSGAGNLGTMATILSGSNNSGSTETVAMTWRTRATGELPGSATSPPMSPANGAYFLTSDVMQLTGPVRGTDTYVLQMSFSPTALGGQSSVSTEAEDGDLYLGALNADTGLWGNAVALNTSGTSNFVLGAWNSSYALGTYGVDPNTDVAWAVLNSGGGTFAVVPEPGTLILLLVGAGALAPLVHRRWKAAKRRNQASGTA